MSRTASFAYDGLPIEDYGTLQNALLDGPSVAATVSFTVQWSGTTSQIAVRNPTEGFQGIFFEDTATLEWSASSPDQNFTYMSDPASTSTSVFAEIGVERNGVFFR
jgi:coproporphyrinogen III oxidase